MKKLLFFLGIFAFAAQCVEAATIKAEALMTIPQTYAAYDNGRNEQMSLASVEDVGSDAVITIFDDGFLPKKSFTLTGVNEEDQSFVFGADISGMEPRMVATKGVFTDDDKWCVIIAKSDPTNYSFYKFFLYNEENKLLGELPNLGNRNEHPLFIFSRVAEPGGKLMYATVSSIEGKDYVTFWNIQADSGIKSTAADTKDSKAYPNPVPAGESVMITLAYTASANTVVNVVDMRGCIVYSSVIEAGSETFLIPGGTLPSGVLIYTVVYPEGHATSGKICIE